MHFFPRASDEPLFDKKTRADVIPAGVLSLSSLLNLISVFDLLSIAVLFLIAALLQPCQNDVSAVSSVKAENYRPVSIMLL